MVVDFLVQMALGLRHVHERRVLHRWVGERALGRPQALGG